MLISSNVSVGKFDDPRSIRIKAGYRLNNLRRLPFSARLFLCRNCQIASADIGLVIVTLFVQQLGQRLPVQPSYIKWPVRVFHEIVREESPFAEGVASFYGFEAFGCRHDNRIRFSNVIMVCFRIEVLLDPGHELLAIDCNEELIATGLYPRKGEWKQLRKSRPVDVSSFNLTLFENKFQPTDGASTSYAISAVGSVMLETRAFRRSSASAS